MTSAVGPEVLELGDVVAVRRREHGSVPRVRRSARTPQYPYRHCNAGALEAVYRGDSAEAPSDAIRCGTLTTTGRCTSASQRTSMTGPRPGRSSATSARGTACGYACRAFPRELCLIARAACGALPCDPTAGCAAPVRRVGRPADHQGVLRVRSRWRGTAWQRTNAQGSGFSAGRK